MTERCSICKKPPDKNDLYMCDFCKDQNCQECAGLNATEGRVMQLKKDRSLMYCCKKCKIDSDGPRKYSRLVEHLKMIEISVLDEMNKLYKKFTEEIQKTVSQEGMKLQESLETNNNKVLGELKEVNTKIVNYQTNIKSNVEIQGRSVEVKEKSYAEVTREVVVIKPKNKQESKITKEAVQKSINPSELEVGIKSIKNTREGGVVIECRSEKEVEKLKTVAEQRLTEYNVKIPNQKNPCIKIIGIEENMSTEELKHTILNQNSFLMNDNLQFEVKVVKKMKTLYMAIVECNPRTLCVLL